MSKKCFRIQFKIIYSKNHKELIISQILSKILSKAQPSSHPLFVFDLDSTLFCVRNRTKKILLQAIQKLSIQDSSPKAAQKLRDLNIHPRDFSFKQILARTGIQTNTPLYKKLFEFWTRNFFSNGFLNEDTLYKGAQNYIEALQNRGAEIMYLTGRHQESMSEGTFDQIKKFSLPLKKSSHLIMKPNSFTEDAYFKKDQLDGLSKKYNKIWFFENEPVIINFVNKFLPEIQIVFVDTAHSQRQQLRKSFPRISQDSWNDWHLDQT